MRTRAAVLSRPRNKSRKPDQQQTLIVTCSRSGGSPPNGSFFAIAGMPNGDRPSRQSGHLLFRIEGLTILAFRQRNNPPVHLNSASIVTWRHRWLLILTWLLIARFLMQIARRHWLREKLQKESLAIVDDAIRRAVVTNHMYPRRLKPRYQRTQHVA